jgi:hypothetical protein
MRCRTLLTLAALAFTLACGEPSVQLRRQDPGFQLVQLTRLPIAIFPVAAGDFDESVASTIASEYGSEAKFLDALSGTWGLNIAHAGTVGCLLPAKVGEALSAKNDRNLLSTGKAFVETAPEHHPTQEEFISRIAQHPVLTQFRYAILPIHVRNGRQLAPPPGPDPFQPGLTFSNTPTSYRTSASLRVVVLDLRTRQVVWEGQVTAHAGSTIMKATALHEIEEDLGQRFREAILN